MIPAGKGAGAHVSCNNCAGKGYTWEGLTKTYARECKVCHGRGYVVVQR